MTPETIYESGMLSDFEIKSLLSENLLESIVYGFMVKPSVLGGIMLRAKGEDEKQIFYRCDDYYSHKDLVRCQWCQYMRIDKNLKKTCDECDYFAFQVAFEKSKNPDWNGFTYICKGGLIDFVVPIRVQRTNQFIGIAFHGQLRPYDKDKESTRERLRNFRFNIARYYNLTEEIKWYDNLDSPTDEDKSLMTEEISIKLREIKKGTDIYQPHILSIPLNEMVSKYLSAPMIKVNQDILNILPNTLDLWNSNSEVRNEISKKANLDEIDFKPIDESEQYRENMPDMLESCKSLARLVSEAVEFHVTKKIENYIINYIQQNIIKLKNLGQFWESLSEICELIAIWRKPCEVFAINFNNEIKSYSTVEATCIANKKFTDGKIIDGKLGAIEIEKSQLIELEQVSSPENFLLSSIKKFTTKTPTNVWKLAIFNNYGLISGIILILSKDNTNSKSKLSNIENSLNNIKFTLNERFNQLILKSELEDSVESHKTALLCITHSIQRPLVEIQSGITYLRTFGELNNNINKWMTQIKHITEDAQIIAECYSKVFKFSMDSDSRIDYKNDLINVDDEIISLAKRMRLYREGDEEGEKEVKNRPNKKNLALIYEKKIKTVSVRTDRHTFIFVIYNLLDNAIKYSYKNRKIIFEFSTERTDINDNRLYLKVKSFGVPIPIKKGEEDLPFNLFWRGENQPGFKNIGTSFYPGLGVGLWACRYLLDCQSQHLPDIKKGEIKLLSKDNPNDNQTIFAVRFPNYEQQIGEIF